MQERGDRNGYKYSRVKSRVHPSWSDFRRTCVENWVNNATLYRKMTGKSEFYRNELQVIRDVLCLNDEKFLLIFFDNKLAKMQEKQSAY